MDGFISIDAWQEQSTLSFDQYLSDYVEAGFTHTVCTDVSKDGALAGPAFDLYERIKKNHPDLYLIASGGMSKVSEIDELISINVDAVIIGKAIYEGRITMKELERFL
jgi:phosphoribosylformimino-5-aminoimidazole carboxamide ribotide isomerase